MSCQVVVFPFQSVNDLGECVNDKNISRVSDQNGISLLYIMLEIHRSGQEPSIFISFPATSTVYHWDGSAQY